MPQSLYEYCRQTGKETLLEQWDTAQNAPLTVQDVSYGSKRHVSWQCKYGHHWSAAVYTRTGSGSGCPFCAGKRIWVGKNDLASQYPALIEQWHPTKNLSLLPNMLLPGSHQKVWWLCAKGHEWQASVKSRTNGAGCPICANRKISVGTNDLAAVFPSLAAEWHPTRNAFTAKQILPGSHKKVWWLCSKGHEWQASVSSRTYHSAGCPYCMGRRVIAGQNDLMSLFPVIAHEWDRAKNGSLSPESVAATSNRKVWWLCSLGHSYCAAVSARTAEGSSCPYCAGRKVLPGFNDLETSYPEIAAQWQNTRNGTLTPQMVSAGSHRSVWWQCPFGHVWKARIYARTGMQRSGCPVCAGRIRQVPTGRGAEEALSGTAVR